jgi:hypothetical protein
VTAIGLYHDAWSGLGEAPITLRRPLLLFRKAMWFKANPRSADYMRARLAEAWPAARFFDCGTEPDWEQAAAAAGDVVLLYPDAIGIGFGDIERRLQSVAPRATLHVLNGRRRGFLLDAATHRALRLRRFLECSMLVEIVFGCGFLLATPVLLGVDWARGRR